MKFEKLSLALGKASDIYHPTYRYPYPLPRRPVRDRRDDEVTGILEANEPAIKQVVDARRQEQAIFAVKSLLI